MTNPSDPLPSRSSPQAPSSAWFTQAFGSDYLERYAHRDDHSAAAEVAGIIPRLRTGQGPVCDVGCGNGRHLDVLRQAGIPTVGCDLSADLLTAATQRALINGRVFRADMRQPALAPASCRAAVLLFTAFGYFDDAANQATLTALATTVERDGWLVLDLPNPKPLRDKLVPRSTRILSDGREILEERWFEAGRVRKRITYPEPDHAVYWEDVRIYERSELVDLCAQAGAPVEDVWYSLRGPEHDDGRLVIWGRRR